MRATALPGLALGLLVSIGLTSPARGQVTATSKVKSVETKVPGRSTATKLDLNRATIDQLQELPGIGPARAAAIVKARPFRAVEDLKSIRGITPAMIQELGPLVTVSPVNPTPTPTTTTTETTVKRPMAKGSTSSTTTTTIPATPTTPATTTTTVKPAMPRPGTTTTTETIKTPRGTTTTTTRAVSKEDDPDHQARKKAALTPGRKINLNTASVEELEELPYIGPVRAASIVKSRPYATIEDVMKAEGIKDGIFAHLKDHISVR